MMRQSDCDAAYEELADYLLKWRKKYSCETPLFFGIMSIALSEHLSLETGLPVEAITNVIKQRLKDLPRQVRDDMEKN